MGGLVQYDIDLFYWINGHHTPWLDWVMWVASQGWSWAVVLVAAVVYLAVGQKRWQWLWILAGIGLCFLLSDRISVLCFKEVFCRLRPCHALEGVRMFHTSCGGAYGFVSSHAANVFALAMFLSLWRKKEGGGRPPKQGYEPLPIERKPLRGIFPILLFLWAILVCYSRPYLGKHYPGDVVCGATLGLAVGGIVFLLVRWGEKYFQKKSSKK